MSVKIRLTRRGRKQNPKFRIVAIDSRAKREGAYLEKLGNYDPMQEPAAITVNSERIGYWLSVGAKPTKTVEEILKKHLNK